MDDWNIPEYTVTFLSMVGADYVEELKMIWTNKIPINIELNTKILDFMIKKKKNILGNERQEILEYIKKKNKKVTDKEIDDAFECIDNVLKSGHSLILSCQKCSKGIFSLLKWFYKPYDPPRNIIYMNEEEVLFLGFKKDKLKCPSCETRFLYNNITKIYEVKKNYSVKDYYTYKKK